MRIPRSKGNYLQVSERTNFADGKQTKTSFDNLMGGRDKKAAGEVDLTEGDKTIKGAFTVKRVSREKIKLWRNL